MSAIERSRHVSIDRSLQASSSGLSSKAIAKRIARAMPFMMSTDGCRRMAFSLKPSESLR